MALACTALAACAPEVRSNGARQLTLGERAYQKCYSCHALKPGENDLQGPTLHGIVGRSVAAEPGFDYSPALRRFALRESQWTRELLDRFVADPEALVPGTSMTFHGIADPSERAAIIAYLDAHTRASATSFP